MKEKTASWSEKRLMGAGVIAQRGRALSEIDLRKGPVVPRQILMHRHSQTLVSAPLEASGDKSRQLPIWDWKWFLSADFSDFHRSENLYTRKHLRELCLVMILQKRSLSPRGCQGLAQGHKVTKLI